MLSCSLFAQDLNLGQPLKTKTSFSDLIGTIDGNHYLWAYEKSGLKYVSSIGKVDENLKIVKSEELDFAEGKMKHQTTDAVIFQDRIFVFTKIRIKKEKRVDYYYGELDPNTLQLTGKLKQIGSESAESRKYRGGITVHTGEENMIAWINTPYLKDGEEKFRCIVIDSEANERDLLVYLVKYKKKQFGVITH